MRQPGYLDTKVARLFLLDFECPFSNVTCEVAMKTFTVPVLLVIVWLLSCSCFASNQATDLQVGFCGYDNIKISYIKRADYLMGCEGIARAKTFFEKYGYTVEVPVRLYFRQRVHAVIGHPGKDKKQIYSCFHPGTMAIHVSSLTSPFVEDPEKVCFGIGHHEETENGKRQRRLIREEFHRSIITHEVAHLYSQHNFNLQSSRAPRTATQMGHGVHEYIASVVQLSTMEPALRQRILQSYLPEIIFDDEQQINMVLYACDPEKFCIMSFRHFYSMNENQQRIFLDRIFSNTLNPDLVFDLAL